MPMNHAVGIDAPTWLCIDSPAYQARKCEHYTCKGDIKLAYGVDTHPNPPEYPNGHVEWDVVDGKPIHKWVRDYDESGQKIEEEAQ